MRWWTTSLLLLLLGACAPQPPPASSCPEGLKPALQVDLYFGRNTPRGEVTETEWAKFLADEVTPRFPDGLSVFDVAGQYREPPGQITRERTKLLVVVVFDAPGHEPQIKAVMDAYARRFAQHSVFRVEHPVCAGA
ncbi:MAG TPA: DUF3574 domain-containing protein [Reyranella sp.]|jgi:hypothetical protein|nr:DUF3574 domain-containing protein [Reyranella sp.]